MVLGFIPSSNEGEAAKEDAPEADEDQDAAESDEDKTEEETTAAAETDAFKNAFSALDTLYQQVKRAILKIWDNPVVCLLRIAAGAYLVKEQLQPKAEEFYSFSHSLADGLSQPSIMFRASLQNGQQIIVDDYREAYHWLRDKTPEDSRVMAWWDYGYQITSVQSASTGFFVSTIASNKHVAAQGDRQPDDDCGWQHLESRTHRDARAHFELA